MTENRLNLTLRGPVLFCVMDFIKVKLAGTLLKGQGLLAQSLTQHRSLTNVLILGPHHCSKRLVPKKIQGGDNITWSFCIP